MMGSCIHHSAFNTFKQTYLSLTHVLSLGFTKVCTIEDVEKAYPLLDMVDHDKRNAVAKGNHPDDEQFPPVEGKFE